MPSPNPRSCPLTEDSRSALQAALGAGYELERELGGGGMSRVYVARDTTLGRRVVVKVLPRELAEGVSIDRFRREIALAASMQHPHIVPLLAAGASQEPLWFTMPLIEGQSLRDKLQRGGELPLAEAVRVLREVADALSYAHRVGVVHRDMKPENVMLSNGHAMVMDFGVAKAVSESGTRNTALTDARFALGTPAYMAPEQASADPNVDHRADIYAFGVVAYEVLTGLPPFAGSSPAQVIRAHMTETAPLVSARRDLVPPLLSDLVARCLAKRPADRPQSADELVQVLDASSTMTSAATQVSGARSPAPVSRARWQLPVAALVVVAVGAGAFLFLRGKPAAAVSPGARPRVVVTPFTNETGDTAFDGLGSIVANWTQDAFTRADLLDVADFHSLVTADGKPMVYGTATASVKAVADAAGATRVITGSVYKLGDSVEFRGSIIDGKTSTVVKVLEPVRGAAKEPLAAVEQLARRAAGALAIAESKAGVNAVFAGASHLPTFDAYKAFVNGMDAYAASRFDQAADHFRASVAADAQFLSAQVALMQARNQAGEPRDTIVALVRALRARRAEMTPLDQSVVDMMSAIRDTIDRDAELRARRRSAELWPERYVPNLAFALNHVGRPREALAVSKTVDPTRGFVRTWEQYYNNMVISNWMTGNNQQALAEAEAGVARLPERASVAAYYVGALAAVGKLHEADSVMTSVVPQLERASRYVRRGWSLAAYFIARDRPAAELRAFEERHRDFLRANMPKGSATARREELLDVYEHLRDSASVFALADSLVKEAPKTRVPLLDLAVAEAAFGHRNEASAALARAESLPEQSANADLELARAVVASLLGDKAEAVRWVQAAVRRGASLDFMYVQIEFLPLRDYPPFKALFAN